MRTTGMTREQAAQRFERLSKFPLRHAANLRRARLHVQADAAQRLGERMIKCAKRLRGQEY
jgi:hypothetical protein